MSIKFKRNYYLDKLEKVLSYDLSSRTPSIAFLNMDGVARSWILISILSTPYILWLLLKLRKFGWLITFSVFVLIPFVCNYLLIQKDLARLLISLIALLNWAVFLFFLKQSYRDWKEPNFTNTPGSDFK